MRQAALGLLLAAALAPPAAAEVRRMEARGVALVHAEGPGPGALRERALRAAIADAVDRVALELLAEAGRLPPEFDSEALDAVLGRERIDYAMRFRIVTDLGVRAPRQPEDAEAQGEYVVVAAVHVDVERVRGRLVAAGLLEPPRAAPAAAGREVRVVLEPLGSYRAYAWVREALGATPVEFERGRAVLAVATTHEPERLARLLRREAPAGIRVEVRRVDRESLTLALEEIDTVGAKGY